MNLTCLLLLACAVAIAKGQDSRAWPSAISQLVPMPQVVTVLPNLHAGNASSFVQDKRMQ